MSTPVLYTFTHAIWPQAPLLGLVELGYPEDALEVKQVNLVDGENFKPDFVKLNPNATLPTLVAGSETYIDSISVTSWLAKHAPKPFEGPSPPNDFLTVIHEESIDPNLAFLATRHDEELKAKSGGFPGIFVNNRQAALEKYSSSAPVEFAEFYTQKLASNGFVKSVYDAEAVEAHTSAWFAKSKDNWNAINKFILEKLPIYIPDGKFISARPDPGEEDLHLAAWLARIVLLNGGDKSAEGVEALSKEPGQPVSSELKTYWANWAKRPSWQKVYADGLH